MSLTETVNTDISILESWEIKNISHKNKRGKFEIMRRGSQRTIAWIRGGYKDSDRNARIIAAAPDMYRACALALQCPNLDKDVRDEIVKAMTGNGHFSSKLV